MPDASFAAWAFIGLYYVISRAPMRQVAALYAEQRRVVGNWGIS